MTQAKLLPSSRSIEERNRLVEENLGLVYSQVNALVKRHAWMKSYREDLVQEGIVALIHSAAAWNTTLPGASKFSNFAHICIRHKLMRWMDKNFWVKDGKREKGSGHKLRYMSRPRVEYIDEAHSPIRREEKINDTLPEQLDELRREIKRLTVRLRWIVVEWINGWNYEGMSKICGVSRSRIAQLGDQAIVKLAIRMLRRRREVS